MPGFVSSSIDRGVLPLTLAAGLIIAVFGSAQPLRAQGFEIEFRFEGNSTVSSYELGRALSVLRLELERRGVDAAAVDDAAYELTQYYRSRGFPDVEIEGESASEREEGRAVLTFRINEGVRDLVESISFEGNEFFSDSELARCLEWLATGVFGIGAETGTLGRYVFTDEVFAAGLDCVRQRYLFQGHYFAEVDGSVERPEPGKVVAVIRVKEGARVEVRRDPEIIGVESFPLEEVRAALALELPETFTPRLPVILRGRLREFYRTRGFHDVEVTTGRSLDADTSEATLTFTVQEGQRTHVHEVRVGGNQKTLDWVILQRVKVFPGDLFDESKVRETHRSLFRSGLFRSVRLETTPSESREAEVDLNVMVTEKPRYRLSLLGGWGSWEQLRGGAAIENINFFGTGHRLRGEGKVSFRGEKGELQYVNPFFFNERLTLRTRAFGERIERPSYEMREAGFDTGFVYYLTEDIRSEAFYRLRRSRALNLKEEIPEELDEDVIISSVVFATTLDYRDSVIDPRRGWMSRFVVEYAGKPIGSQLQYVRPTLLLSWVVPLFWDVRLASSARGGVIFPIEDTVEIPIQERFFSGGQTSIRSFEEDQAGPRIGDEPIGGEAFTTYNLELRFPIIGGLQGAFFGDAGTVNLRREDFGGGRYFFAVGGGLRYYTPVGPIRFDAAWNPDRADGEDSFEFHFGLGFPF